MEITKDYINKAIQILKEHKIPGNYIIYLPEDEAKRVIENIYGKKFKPDKDGIQVINDIIIKII